MSNKQPKLVLRESCVDDMSREWPPCRFLEVGAGTGHMARRFLERGYTGACHDIGEGSRQRIRTNLANFGDRVRVVDALEELEPASFDALLAFEVMEHIEDDRTALAEWSRYLKPGGRLLVSVPAHQRKFGRSDELVGHVRRYERAQLHRLLGDGGFRDIRIVNYGFPITELTRMVSNRLVRLDRSTSSLSAEQRSIRSATRKPAVIDRTLDVIGSRWVEPFKVLQRWFYDRDLGDGLVATAVKQA